MPVGTCFRKEALPGKKRQWFAASVPQERLMASPNEKLSGKCSYETKLKEKSS